MLKVNDSELNVVRVSKSHKSVFCFHFQNGVDADEHADILLEEFFFIILIKIEFIFVFIVQFIILLLKTFKFSKSLNRVLPQ